MWDLYTLDDTNWSVADVIGPIGTGSHVFSIDFATKNNQYSSIRFEGNTEEGALFYDDLQVTSYPAGTWLDPEYQRIAIAGGIDATDPVLRAWFQQNAQNTTPIGGDSGIVDAINNVAQAVRESGGGGGGIPEGYPFKLEVRCDETVTITDARAYLTVVGENRLSATAVIVDGNGLEWDGAATWTYTNDDNITYVVEKIDANWWLTVTDVSENIVPGDYGVLIQEELIDQSFELAAYDSTQIFCVSLYDIMHNISSRQAIYEKTLAMGRFPIVYDDGAGVYRMDAPVLISGVQQLDSPWIINFTQTWDTPDGAGVLTYCDHYRLEWYTNDTQELFLSRDSIPQFEIVHNQAD